MTKVTPITKNTVVDLSEYHNNKTGEALDSELKPGTKVTIKEKTGMVNISSNDYAVIDTQAIQILAKMLNNSDLANVIKMAVCSKTPLNLIYNNTIPHTNETLQKYLEVSSESKYIELIKRLMKAGILYQIKGLIYGEIRVIYMINPFLSSKRKTFDERLIGIFTEFKLLNP